MAKNHRTSQNIESRDCKNCGNEFTIEVKKKSQCCSRKCMYELRDKKTSLTCKNCEEKFEGLRTEFCSGRCYTLYSTNQSNSAGTLGHDFIQCPICFTKVKQISNKHAMMHGFSSVKDMKESLSMDETVCEAKKIKSRGENNPGYQHGGKLSKFSKKYLHGYDQEWHQEFSKNQIALRKANPEKYINNIEYWLAKYDGDVETAKKEYKKFQTKNLDFFIEKYGEEEGRKRHLKKTERWIKSMSTMNFSSISQELFHQIHEIFKNKKIDDSNVYYATNHRSDMLKYENKEYRLKTKTSYVMPDFIDLSTKKIIEFDGTYWHSDLVGNPKREKKRDKEIADLGYEVLHVKELDFRNNQEKVLQECISFLIK